MLGEDEADTQEGSFNSKSVWARMAIVFAGPFFNFILALLLALIVVGYAGADIPYINHVREGSAAYEAGLREGDRIVKYNGADATISRAISLEDYINPLTSSSQVEIKYKRDGKTQTATFAPEKKYMVGIGYNVYENVPAVIDTVVENGAMEVAGVKEGDIIVSIEGNKINSGKELNEYIENHPWDSQKREITLTRDGEEFTVMVEAKDSDTYTTGIGINYDRSKQGILGTVKYSLAEVKYNVDMVIKSLGMLIRGKVSTNDMSGPIGIVDTIGTVYENVKPSGFVTILMTMLNLAIMLSANLGVMNLLPIPALDGGRLLFFIIEAVRRKPVDRDKEGFVHFVGFVLLMILMLFLIVNDIKRIL